MITSAQRFSLSRVVSMGFTLIELLVVIAIIAILAALLLPALARAKSQGLRTACVNNQKQIAIAYKLYVDDNQGSFPVHSGWADFGGKQATNYPDIPAQVSGRDHGHGPKPLEPTA